MYIEKLNFISYSVKLLTDTPSTQSGRFKVTVVLTTGRQQEHVVASACRLNELLVYCCRSTNHYLCNFRVIPPKRESEAHKQPSFVQEVRLVSSLGHSSSNSMYRLLSQ